MEKSTFESAGELRLRIGNTMAFSEFWFVRRWVCWDNSKIPHTPNTTQRASSTNPDTWGDINSALASVESGAMNGIGLVLNGDGLVCIDLDKCIDEQGELTAQAQQILELFADTYAEYSPSKRGIHIWCKTSRPLPADGKRTDGIEIYQSKRYITITGNRLANHPDEIIDCTQQLHQLYSDLFGDDEQLDSGLDVDVDVDAGANGDENQKPKRERYIVPDYDLNCRLVAYAITDDTDDDTLIEAFLAEEENRILWMGGQLPQHPSPSEADCALAYRLMWLTGGDSVRTERLFNLSARVDREKIRKRRDLITRAIRVAKQYYLRRQPTNQTATVSKDDWELSQVLPSQHLFGSEAYSADVVARAASEHILFHTVNGEWLCYEKHSGLWRRDPHNGYIHRVILDTLYHHYQLVAGTEPDRAKDADKGREYYSKIENVAKVRRQLETHAELYTDGSEFDQNPLLIPLKNGVWDVERGVLRDYQPEMFITQQINARYDASQPTPHWNKALDDWCWDDSLGMPNTELREYLLHALGYTLTGSVREQKLFVIHGPGATGKSTLLTIMQHILADYGGMLADDVITDEKNTYRELERALAPLHNKRFVLHPELAEKATLATEKIKRIVSTEGLFIRKLYHETERITPTHTIWVATNYIPACDDPALWRRVAIIPFLSVFDEHANTLYHKQPPDKDLLEKLRAESDGIATQLCHYATQWFRNGLPDCQTIREYTALHRSESDPFEEWFGSCVIASPNNRVLNDDAYNNYREWMREQDQPTLSKEAWGKRMRMKGVSVQRLRTNGVLKRFCLGISLQ